MAESVPAGALSFGGRFRTGRPLPAQGRAGDGTSVFAGRPAAGAVAARRDTHHQQLHRASVVDFAGVLRRAGGSAQRLGARSGEAAAVVLSPSALYAWSH